MQSKKRQVNLKTRPKTGLACAGFSHIDQYKNVTWYTGDFSIVTLHIYISGIELKHFG